MSLKQRKKEDISEVLKKQSQKTNLIKHHNTANKCYGYGACKNSKQLKTYYVKRENELNGILTYDRAINKFKFDKH